MALITLLLNVFVPRLLPQSRGSVLLCRGAINALFLIRYNRADDVSPPHPTPRGTPELTSAAIVPRSDVGGM